MMRFYTVVFLALLTFAAAAKADDAPPAPPQPALSTAPAPLSSGTCKTVEDCKDYCKDAGKGSECEADGVPSCDDSKCACELNCL
jgi:hypothetical protein